MFVCRFLPDGFFHSPHSFWASFSMNGYVGSRSGNSQNPMSLIKVRVSFRTALHNGGQRKAAFGHKTYWGILDVSCALRERSQVWTVCSRIASAFCRSCHANFCVEMGPSCEGIGLKLPC